VNIIFFAAEGTAKENISTFKKLNIIMNYRWLLFDSTGMHVFAFRPLSGKQKETNSLLSLRLGGDYKLSNYNTILYLRILVLR